MTKAFWSDTGLALHLAREEPSGGHLENLVLGDLLAWRDSSRTRPELLYRRTYDGTEVDFVIESGGQLIAIAGDEIEWIAEGILAAPRWRVL